MPAVIVIPHSGFKGKEVTSAIELLERRGYSTTIAAPKRQGCVSEDGILIFPDIDSKDLIILPERVIDKLLFICDFGWIELKNILELKEKVSGMIEIGKPVFFIGKAQLLAVYWKIIKETGIAVVDNLTRSELRLLKNSAVEVTGLKSVRYNNIYLAYSVEDCKRYLEI